MGIFGFLKADKKDDIKVGATVHTGTGEGIMGRGNSNPMDDAPHGDTFKAYIPNFLYKPPFGYPLNKNVVQLKNLAKNAYVFSVIRTLKDEAATCKFEIKLKKEFADLKFKEDGHNDAIKQISYWFYNPNGNEESFNEIIGQWVVDLCEVDAAVGVKVFTKGKKFSQLFARDGGSFLKNPDIYGYLGNRQDFVLPVEEFNKSIDSGLIMPDKIKFYAASYGDQAAYYQYGWTGNALPVPFGRREIMYICANPRADSIYGRSPIEILYDTLLTLIYGQQYNLDFYINGNAPDGIIQLTGADAEIAKGYQERIKDKFKVNDVLGYSKRIGHQYPVYTGPEAKFIPFQLNAKDMEILEQQKWFTKLVWAAFGVTPDEMGFTEDSNKAVSQTQSALHKRKALRPMLKKIEYTINTQLMPELDPSGLYEFCFEDYDIEEEMRKYLLYEKQIQIGVKTPMMVAEEEGINTEQLKKDKEEEHNKKVQEAQQTNPGFFEKKPEFNPSTKGNVDLKPFAGYKDFAECVSKNSDKGDAKAYCATIMRKVEGKAESPWKTDSIGNINEIKATEEEEGLVFDNKAKIKADYLKMDLDELISEHKKLVKILEEGNDKELIKEAEDQKKELESYIEKKKATVKSEDKKDTIVAHFEKIRDELLKKVEAENGF